MSNPVRSGGMGGKGKGMGATKISAPKLGVSIGTPKVKAAKLAKAVKNSNFNLVTNVKTGAQYKIPTVKPFKPTDRFKGQKYA